jgi:starch-binding outer membrane protein, SusD/RagB family
MITKIRIFKRTSSMLRGLGGLVLALFMGLQLTACDFDVVNPGPVQDDFLNDPDAHEPMVAGASRLLMQGLNFNAYTGAAVTRELFPAGSTSAHGITLLQQRGLLEWDDEHVTWTNHQRARAVAEEGLERFEGIDGIDFMNYGPAARMALVAGYAGRVLGENYCQAVINGGGEEPREVFLERGEGFFDLAIQIGQNTGQTDVVTAAYAGRAQTRANLGNWAGALSDADQVPSDFVFQAEHNTISDAQYNRIYWASANQPYRAHSVWNTVAEEYYAETGDPRTPWGMDENIPFGDAAVDRVGQVPWYFQLKYPSRDANRNLASGREMDLIRAEAALVDGNWQTAMDYINGLREGLVSDHDGEPIPLWEANSLEEAWTHLKRERYIELWLEGRRLNDLRRWQEDNRPGELSPLEVPGDASYLDQNQSLCYPIPEQERETNPNIPDTPSG